MAGTNSRPDAEAIRDNLRSGTKFAGVLAEFTGVPPYDDNPKGDYTLEMNVMLRGDKEAVPARVLHKMARKTIDLSKCHSAACFRGYKWTATQMSDVWCLVHYNFKCKCADDDVRDKCFTQVVFVVDELNRTYVKF
jgi:hypothetical protein